MNSGQQEIVEHVIGALRRAATRLNQARLPELSHAMDQLAAEVLAPCVVAVVGRMKAGKSSFINALLRQDLAKVEVTETTATINKFVFGKGEDNRPVRCFWRNGKVTSETKEFLDGLQGNQPETLRRAMEIQYLEYSIENDYLRDVILVDTPGMCTTVDEHKDRTAEFLQLASQLRDRHSSDTVRLGNQADAVIYLVGEVARQTDEAFLSEFHAVTSRGADALNAVGVLAKVDLSPTILKRRKELSAKIAEQLKESVNTVIPVSAGIRRALDRMDAGELPPLAQYVDQLRQIPKSRMQKMLDNEEFYRELELDAGLPSVATREALLADLPWAVFATIAHMAATKGLDPEAVGSKLNDLSGFGQVTQVLEEHLFRRGRLLRAYSTLQKARSIVEQMRFGPLAKEAIETDRHMRAKRDRFLAFVHSSQGDPDIAQELEEYLTQYGPRTSHTSRLESAYTETARELAGLRIVLEEYSNDFSALQTLQKAKGAFPAEEVDELCALFGMYGLGTKMRLRGEPSLEVAAGRQQYWRGEARYTSDEFRRQAATRAEQTYGSLLSRLVGG